MIEGLQTQNTKRRSHELVTYGVPFSPYVSLTGKKEIYLFQLFLNVDYFNECWNLEGRMPPREIVGFVSWTCYA